MVDTPVLGTGALQRVGSSPTEGIFNIMLHIKF